MKDSLFVLLLDLFEKTLNHIKTQSNSEQQNEVIKLDDPSSSLVLKEASSHAMRIYTEDETIKLTKASYQFLVRLSSWQIVSQEVLELVLHQLALSKEAIITLDELKWAVRKAVENVLDFEQLAYLDLVLYQKEDGLLPH